LSSTSSQRLPYAAALDGLRAIAVIAVVGYHLDISWMQGGFLGVDLFFVISGFLITRLLLGEQEQTGRIALGAFWMRRFRRLVPPLVIVVAASVAATRLWGVPEQWDAIRGDTFAALGYVANWRFILNDVSYFETLLGPSPLRHIWSLAVEEQWYVIWPLVMAVLAPWAARRQRLGSMSIAVFVAASLSAIWMAVLYDPVDLSRVYYGTDTRAQQLLVGAGLAWVTVAAPARFSATALARHRLAFGLLLLGFVAAIVFINDEAPWLYRGGLLGISIVAAALVAAASLPGSDGPLSWLSARPLVAIGHRSYSLYLWHWPVIVFVGPPMGLELPTVPLILLQLAVSIALTEVTYRWIETPTRRSSQRPVKTFIAWTSAAAITVVGASAALTTELTALPDIDVLRPAFIPPPNTAATNSDSVNTVPVNTVLSDNLPLENASSAEGSVEVESVAVEVLPAAEGAAGDEATAPTAALAPRLMLVGDSTAVVLAEGQRVGFPAGWESVEYGRIGCALTAGRPIDVDDDQPTGFYDPNACGEWVIDWTELSQQFQPSVSVVMVGAWEVLDHVVDGRRLSFPSDEWTDHVDMAIRRGAEAASAGGGRVVLLRLPCMVQPTASLVNVQARNDRARVEAFNAVLDGVATELTLVDTLPLDELLCPDGEPVGDINGEAIRFDGVHLTDAGTQLVWTWLGDELAALRSPVG
jgi:peptidoglycan/LPS O-acetylase OafA/YrhL